ncbi:MAG: hypothetical protein MJ212_00295 [Alphaproteobacteria bacterium]|nr:hypothetical protein [Alphaproteobacteria bacterium]
MRNILTTMLAVTLSCGILFAKPAVAEESESGLALPRMVSLRSSLINARSGPGSRYPIEWVYRQKGAPVEIVAEFELWRKIKDWEGAETWVHKAMLSGRRFVRVVNPGENNIYAKPNTDSRVLAKVEDGVVGEIEQCPAPKGMCLIKFDNIKGWMVRHVLFGIYENEVIK